MKRSKRVLIVAGCMLNASAKVLPLAPYAGVNRSFLTPWIEKDAGILQLPCPETTFLGMKRWGMTKEQYDTVCFKEHCKDILRPFLLELCAYADAGYIIEGVAGIKGSPSCGIYYTCFGYVGGEAGCKVSPAYIAEGRGVFMEIVIEEMKKILPEIKLIEVDEEKQC